MTDEDDGGVGRDQSAPDCGLCGAENEGVNWVPVTNEETGETIEADLCDDCLNEIWEQTTDD